MDSVAVVVIENKQVIAASARRKYSPTRSVVPNRTGEYLLQWIRVNQSHLNLLVWKTQSHPPKHQNIDNSLVSKIDE